jgi:hypothetical protein
MPKVNYTAVKGLVQEAGAGVQLETLPFSPIQTISTVANNTGSLPGVYEFTNTGAVSTLRMPLASSCPGGLFVFKNGTGVAQANVLTGSGEAAGTKVFTNGIDSQIGSSLVLNNIAGSSVALLSTGVSYLILASSGSVTVSGT